MINVTDRPDETDNGSRPAMRHNQLKVSETDRVANDLGEHDGAQGHAVGHIGVLP